VIRTTFWASREKPSGGAITASRERSRRLATGISLTVISRGVSVLVLIILIPITLSYLGPDLYGLWMAVTALTAMVTFADLGLGSSLMTKLSVCYTNGDSGAARRYILGAYLIITPIALGCIAMLWLMSGLIPWSSLFNATGAASSSHARDIALICLSGFLANVPLSLVARVQYAYQQAAQSNLWLAGGNLSTLPLALAAIHANLPPAALIAATVAGPLLANIGNNLWVYLHTMPELAPWRGTLDPSVARQLLGLSGLFLFVTVVASIALYSDTLIIAHALDLRSVTSYAVPARLFAQLGALVSIMNLPTWPANGAALAQGDMAWVRRTTRRMTILCSGSILLASVVLVVASNSFVAAWAGAGLGTDRLLLTGLALWWFLIAAISPCQMVQNSVGVIRPQVVGWSLYLAISMPAKWYTATYLGIAAVPYAGCATYLLTVIPAILIGYRFALSKAGAASPPATQVE
jgi:O-antigen/teichoic acid export membrane protein